MAAQIIAPANAAHCLAPVPPRPPVRKSILLGTALIVTVGVALRMSRALAATPAGFPG